MGHESLTEAKLERLRHLKELQSEAAKVKKGVEKYYADPIGFARDCIDWRGQDGLTFYQEDILDSLQQKRRVSVRGPHGLGKSAISAITVLWFALTREATATDWKVVTTAGAWRQLINYLWPEIRKWSNRLHWQMVRDHPFTGAELLNLSLRLKHGNAFAAAASNPALIEGAHADSLLFIYDESKAIAAQTFDACEGAFSGTGESFAMALSTPGPPQGRFYDIQSRKPGYEDWHVKHVTLEDSKLAGRISDEWAEQRRLQWGENTALYQNRVLGEFYAGEEDAVVPLSWVEAAVERWHEWADNGRQEPGFPHTVGVDIARSGNDKTVLAIRQNNVITEIRTYTASDTMVTTGRVQGVLEADPNCTAIVDVVGVGGGVLDRLNELGSKSQGFNAAGRTRRRDRTGELGFINCLTGDARVTPVGDLLRVYRSRYKDTLYRVKLASGDEFTATRNHQILTSDGWVSVESLNVGSHLLRAKDSRVTSDTPGPHVDHVVPTLSEVYGAAAALFGPERVDHRVVDFHGDRAVDEIDVVTIHRDLLLKYEEAGEQLENVKLMRLLHALGDLTSSSSLEKTSTAIPNDDGWEALELPVTGKFGGSLSPSLSCEVTPDKAVGLSVRPGLNTVFTQDAVDDGFRDTVETSDTFCRLKTTISSKNVVNVTPESSLLRGVSVSGSVLDTLFSEDLAYGDLVGPERLRNRVQGLAGNVAADDIISVEKLASSGHDAPYVYTLETETGVYCTTSIHKNCRAAAWYNIRELLDPSTGSNICLPPNDDLLGDLTAPKASEPMSGGKLKVESKDELRKRIGRSTDHGDAVVQAFWTEAGSWHDAYGTVKCSKCDRGFLATVSGTKRERCPYCNEPVLEDDLEEELVEEELA